MALNFNRIEDEERVKDLAVQIRKAKQDRNKILYKLMDDTDPIDAFWRRMSYRSHARYVDELILRKEMLEQYLAETPPTYILTAGIKFGTHLVRK